MITIMVPVIKENPESDYNQLMKETSEILESL